MSNVDDEKKTLDTKLHPDFLRCSYKIKLLENLRLPFGKESRCDTLHLGK